MLSFFFSKLRTRIIGRIIKEFETVTSTNDLAFDMAVKKEPEGVVVTARSQTSGKGRRGRKWSSEPGMGFYFSVILRPNIASAHIGRVSIAAAVAVNRVLQKRYGVNSLIKWPNDILIDGRKVAGILIENKGSFGMIDFLIAGVGINTNWKKIEASGDYRIKPASLSIESGKQIDDGKLLCELLKEMDSVYRALKKNKWKKILMYAVKNQYAMGSKVCVKKEDGTVMDGLIISGISDDGALLLNDSKGNLITIVSGDVTICS
ncbi:MAG: biotin--[acetyl-CoA-carboxylase] ligase [Spirochaetes bacterium]|nr:biotin--[acetyl-CoA-carboxylase] ligase [Spirochaetota bacterium]